MTGEMRPLNLMPDGEIEMSIYGPRESCPKCNQPESFGRIWINSHTLNFVCGKCRHKESKPLPPIVKRIIYIDQFALSKMVKNKTDKFWGELYDRLTYLTAHQIITSPSSSIHNEESNFNPQLRDSLKAMYRRFAGDDEFRLPEEVEKRQLARSLRSFIGCTKSKPTDLYVHDACKEGPHRWWGIFQIYVDFPYNEELIEALQAAKEASYTSMQSLCDRWRANPRNFVEQAEAEAFAFRDAIEMYRKCTGGDPHQYCPFTSPLKLDVVHWLAQTVQVIDPDENSPLDILEAFADSSHYRETPCIFLKSHIWAKIAELVLNPRGSRKPRASDDYDARVLASYAPYCDAMLLDGGFRGIAIDARIAVEKRFGTRMFSEQVRDDFLTYLEEVERSVPQAHWEALTFIHGIDPRIGAIASEGAN